ncbi:hypothetical protein V493_05636 [Pseudogymnoascus sp. VKM F-4281 (FW-2241)]|nr:hypothetical protein V493_05636 [Pseudogymnoascus sp. VKM F-4281 (FW-2241)]
MSNSSTLISYESLLYIGLSSAKANELWHQWTNWSPGPYDPQRETDPDNGGLTITFDDFIIGWTVDSTADAVGDDDQEWPSPIFGVQTRASTGLRTPLRCDMQGSKTSSAHRAYGRLNYNRRPPFLADLKANKGTVYQGDIGFTSTSSKNQGRRSLSSLQQQGTAGIEVDIWGSATSIAARNAPGCTVLFKGLAQARITGLLDDNGALANIQTLLSPPPSDFSRF